MIFQQTTFKSLLSPLETSNIYPYNMLIKYGDSMLESVTRLYISFSGEQRSPLSLRQLYKFLAKLRKEDIITLLEQHIKASDILDVIDEMKFLDAKKIATLIIWITSSIGFKVSGISLVEDPETKELQFIAVYLKGCGWKEWKMISRIIKKQMMSEGFGDMAELVAIVCREALQVQRD